MNKSRGGWLAAMPFIEKIAVRTADIDDFNHVNNVIYLGWMARTAWAHSKVLGFDFAAYRARDCGFVVAHHEIDYLHPAIVDDTIEVATWITQNDRRLRLRRRFQLRAQQTGQTLAFGLSDYVTMKISTGKACRMPADFASGYPVADGVEAAFLEKTTD